MYRKTQLILAVLVLGLSILGTFSVHATNDQLFFDDFLSNGYPVQWQSGISVNNPTTQAGGYFTLTTLTSVIKSIGISLNAAIANVSTPITGNGSLNNGTDGQFVNMIWKFVPTNMTSPGNAVGSNVEIIFGLSDNTGFLLGSNNAQITFDMLQRNEALGPTAQIFLEVFHPNTGATKCFLAFILSGPCLPGIAYSSQGIGNNNPAFDFSQSHIFTIQMKLFPVSQKSWIAFGVDQNGLMNVTQAACSCIDGPSGKYVRMWPVIWTRYTGEGGGCCISAQPTFSLGTAIDYVIVTDYPLLSKDFPPGQLLSSAVNPPKTNQGIYQPGGFSLTQYVQFEAWSMGSGNIYAGGFLLTGLFLTILSVGLGGAFYKLRLGTQIFGWMWNISTIGLVFFMFYCGVIPLLLPVLTVLGAAAIMFGIVRSGPSSAGGVVPD